MSPSPLRLAAIVSGLCLLLLASAIWAGNRLHSRHLDEAMAAGSAVMATVQEKTFLEAGPYQEHALLLSYRAADGTQHIAHVRVQPGLAEQTEEGSTLEVHHHSQHAGLVAFNGLWRVGWPQDAVLLAMGLCGLVLGGWGLAGIGRRRAVTGG